MTPTFFFFPAKPRKVIWGAGPVFVLPTATSKVLGQGKLSIGPSLVVLLQPSRWTIGALTNNVWSVAGPGSRRAVNQMTLAIFHQLQPEEGLVFILLTDSDRELESLQRKRMDCTRRRRSRASDAVGISASQYHHAILRKCCTAHWRFALGHAVTNCISTPQMMYRVYSLSFRSAPCVM